MDKKEAEDALVARVARVCGRPPVGLRDLLHVLTHPDVIDTTWQYMEECYAVSAPKAVDREAHLRARDGSWAKGPEF